MAAYGFRPDRQNNLKAPQCKLRGFFAEKTSLHYLAPLVVMSWSELEALAQQHRRLTQGAVDYERYAHYAITHHSTVLEGSTLTEAQVFDLLEFGKTAPERPFLHHEMVADHYRALRFVVHEARRHRPPDAAFLRQIAALVMRNTGAAINTILGTYDIAAGDFRLGTVRAGSRTFPAYDKVPRLADELCARLQDELTKANTFQQQCELAFAAHFELVSLHPFGDGNGRASRLLMNFVQSWFALPLGMVAAADRLPYIDALEAARHTGSLAPFHAFMRAQYEQQLRREVQDLTS